MVIDGFFDEDHVFDVVMQPGSDTTADRADYPNRQQPAFLILGKHLRTHGALLHFTRARSLCPFSIPPELCYWKLHILSCYPEAGLEVISQYFNVLWSLLRILLISRAFSDL